MISGVPDRVAKLCGFASIPLVDFNRSRPVQFQRDDSKSNFYTRSHSNLSLHLFVLICIGVHFLLASTAAEIVVAFVAGNLTNIKP